MERWKLIGSDQARQDSHGRDALKSGRERFVSSPCCVPGPLGKAAAQPSWCSSARLERGFIRFSRPSPADLRQPRLGTASRLARPARASGRLGPASVARSMSSNRPSSPPSPACVMGFHPCQPREISVCAPASLPVSYLCSACDAAVGWDPTDKAAVRISVWALIAPQPPVNNTPWRQPEMPPRKKYVRTYTYVQLQALSMPPPMQALPHPI